eukprot:10159163-Karenia_brevis.AAC.1
MADFMQKLQMEVDAYRTSLHGYRAHGSGSGRAECRLCVRRSFTQQCRLRSHVGRHHKQENNF